MSLHAIRAETIEQSRVAECLDIPFPNVRWTPRIGRQHRRLASVLCLAAVSLIITQESRGTQPLQIGHSPAFDRQNQLSVRDENWTVAKGRAAVFRQGEVTLRLELRDRPYSPVSASWTEKALKRPCQTWALVP